MELAASPGAVVFDLDGLMFNTEELYQDVGGELLRRRDREMTHELLDAMMGRPNHVAFRIMIEWHGLSDTVEQLATETDEIFATILDTRLAPMPGLLPLLAALESAGLPKAIATSSPRRFLDNVLSRFSLQPRFEFLLSVEDVVEGKPHPEIYDKAAARLGLPAQRMLVLEDSANGCRAAVAAGARVVAVPGGRSRQQAFPGVEFIAKSLFDPRIYAALGLKRERLGGTL